MNDKQIEKIYAGLLGKLIGIRLGAPVEMWSREEIKEKYQGKEGYLVDYKNFASDDDSNGPTFFFRTLLDYGIKPLPEDFGKTWLNYVPYLHSFFWWGGYGVSTEHTAYLNLLNGVNSPYSGSIEKNGLLIAEQIGGQIFSDFWGLVSLGNIDIAKYYAKLASSVSHAGLGIDGSIFVASAIASAFNQSDIEVVIQQALNELDSQSAYRLCLEDVIKFAKKTTDIEVCYQYIKTNYWKDKFAGNCHIIPNAALMVMSLIYGKGDFDNTLKICNEAGFDTDCNCGNVGTILGVLNGLDKINEKWRAPINDLYICSSVIGYLNIVDIPSMVFEIARQAHKIDKEYSGKYLAELEGNNDLSFVLPNSRHGFVNEKNMIYKYVYFGKENLDDNRYDPATSPTLYKGEILTITVKGFGKYKIFVENTQHQKFYSYETNEESISYPLTINGTILRYGIIYEGDIQIKNVKIEGKAEYYLDFANHQIEDYDLYHKEIQGCTHYSGYWTLSNGKLFTASTTESKLYTFKYSFSNISVETKFKKIYSGSAGLMFRVQGNRKCYELLVEEEKVVLYKYNDGVVETLISQDFKTNEEIILGVVFIKENIQIFINKKLFMMVKDYQFIIKGSVGLVAKNNASVEFSYLDIKEVD
ncbi:MAG: ADP-ribosylglycohydrolase family protein [Bacillales bacterium]|jgi:ADP-ribosylglycohydrolase|nr:ADP-ribosylglycohydrolase family protein [Bacillales bacterium]